MRVGSFLMKTASAFNQPGEDLHSRFQLLLRCEPIAQKVESFLGLADVAFVRVDGKLQGGKDGIHPLDCRLEFVAGLGKDHVVVHEPLIQWLRPVSMRSVRLWMLCCQARIRNEVLFFL